MQTNHVLCLHTMHTTDHASSSASWISEHALGAKGASPDNFISFMILPKHGLHPTVCHFLLLRR